MRKINVTDQQLHWAVDNNDVETLMALFEHKIKPKIDITVLLTACTYPQLQCLDILLPHTRPEDRALILEHAISFNQTHVVQMLTQYSLQQEQWNHALWRACSVKNQEMVETLYPNANIQQVNEMFKELEYTPDEPAYFIFLDQGKREQLKSKLTTETQHNGVSHSKSKM